MSQPLRRAEAGDPAVHPGHNVVKWTAKQRRGGYKNESQNEGDNWPLFRTGFFDASTERFGMIEEKFDERVIFLAGINIY